MNTNLTKIDETKVKLSINATEEDLKSSKETVLKKMAKQVKLPGFREGKAPLNLVEKNVDPSLLQSEFLDEAMTLLYSQAATIEKIRPVTRPEVTVKKFVPFTILEFEVTTEVVGNIKLANYKQIKLAKPKAEVTAKDVDEVIKSLQLRLGEKTEVNRVAQKTDEVWIDFKGVNEKDEPVNGAEGKDYPLVIGSNSFIPGFEDNVEGLKPGDEKTFTLTFPKDYGVKALANKKVKFSVNVKKVQKVTQPKVDDAFAAKVGPFKTVKELKDDIKKQLKVEKQTEVNRKYASELVEKITEKSQMAIPEAMIEQQVEHNLEHFKRDLTYRGQTFEEFLKAEGTTAEKYRQEVLNVEAEKQVKAGLILAEIADAENITITPEELEIRLQILKGQYSDLQMQAELDKTENRQDIASRMLTEKVLQKLEEYAKTTEA